MISFCWKLGNRWRLIDHPFYRFFVMGLGAGRCCSHSSCGYPVFLCLWLWLWQREHLLQWWWWGGEMGDLEGKGVCYTCCMATTFWCTTRLNVITDSFFPRIIIRRWLILYTSNTVRYRAISIMITYWRYLTAEISKIWCYGVVVGMPLWSDDISWHFWVGAADCCKIRFFIVYIYIFFHSSIDTIVLH